MFFLTQTKPNLCRSTGASHRQENGEGGVTREERAVPGPPAKGMRSFTLETLWGSVQLLFFTWIVSSCSHGCFGQSENSTGLVGPAGLWILVTALTASSSRQGGKRGEVMLLMAFQAQRGLCVQLIIRSGSC